MFLKITIRNKEKFPKMFKVKNLYQKLTTIYIIAICSVSGVEQKGYVKQKVNYPSENV